MSEYQIHLGDVQVSYPQNDGDPKIVLDHLGLRIRQGEFVTVVGPSGCGKSTLLRMVLGSQFPTKGQVTLDGKKVEGVGRDRGIVFQKYSLFEHMTVQDNIAFGPEVDRINLFERLLHLPKYWRLQKHYREKAREFVVRMGLAPEDARKHPFELSGGMRQRVAIAQALIMEPAVLLMDEPFGALDDSTRQDMQVLILEQWEKFGMTVLFVTHDLQEACFLGTRIIGLSQYWSHDEGADGIGARIVVDKKIPGKHPKPNEFKYSKEFSELVATIRRDVLDSKVLQKVSAFDLDHDDAWHPPRRPVANGKGE